MQFVNNLSNLVLDDQYFMDVPTPEGSADTPIGNIGLVGTFSRGPLNQPTLVTSYPELVKQFGDVDAAGVLTGALTARGIFKQGNANVYVVRVASAITAPQTASLLVKDGTESAAQVLKLNAKTPGAWGNSLAVNVTAGTKDGTFKVSLQYGNELEVWDNLIVAQPSEPIAGAMLAELVFGADGMSQLATAEFPTTANTNTPAAGAFVMAGGSNGALAAANDYIGDELNGVKTGLSALDSAPVNFVLCAEQGDPLINKKLVENADAITTNGGVPRMAVLTFPRETSVTALGALTKSLRQELAAADAAEDRAIAVFPWVQVQDAASGTTRVVSPLGSFAGVLAQLQPHLSSGNKPVNGILGTDPKSIIGPSDLVKMTEARVNAIGVTTPAGPIGIRGSFTLSDEEVSSQVYVRRMKDYINQLVAEVGGQFVDQPITEDLMRQVYQSVDNVLQPLKSPITPSDRMIVDYKVVCDATNNPAASIASNRLVCDYAVKLLNLNRFMIFRTQIGTGVIVTQQN